MSGHHYVRTLIDTHFSEDLNKITGLTEIAINRPNEKWLKIHGKWERREIDFSFDNAMSIMNSLSDYHDGTSVQKDNSILSATLPTGERVQALAPPITQKDTVAIAIRKPTDFFIPHTQFVDQGFYSRIEKKEAQPKNNSLVKLYESGNIAEFIPECIRQGKTMVFSGGTGSGKTTFSNAALEYIPHHLRCISIEDTDETKFRFHKNHVKLFYPAENKDSPVTAGSLIRSCYRLNPDRILMTEIRGGEAWDFMKATSSGHAGGMTTVHEDSPENAILGIVERCYQNPECGNLPFESLLRKVVNNIDVVMSIKYLDELDSRFVTGVYFKDVDREKMIRKLLG